MLEEWPQCVCVEVVQALGGGNHWEVLPWEEINIVLLGPQ